MGAVVIGEGIEPPSPSFRLIPLSENVVLPLNYPMLLGWGGIPYVELWTH